MTPPLSPRKLRELTQKWLQGTLTPEERLLLENWYNRESPDQIEWRSEDRNEDELKERLFAHIRKEALEERPVTKLKYRRLVTWATAAAAIVLLSTGIYLFNNKQKAAPLYTQNDILPGHNQATLTLANGQQIRLTKGLNGLLARQGQTRINVNQNNITYNAAQNADQLVYNTLSTARGEQSPYPLVLADGTKVWLNAESSITFPTAFNGKERLVKITGEALLEVAHNDKQPFKVQTDRQTIEDIGTTFDVNAYADEPAAKTTLIEGLVKVNGVLLHPGEQSDGLHIKQVNTATITAWKDGKFRFSDENIQTVMRQLARWYNVEIVYEGPITQEGFNAKITRRENISAVLRVLERTHDVHFKIEGRRVTVIE